MTPPSGIGLVLITGCSTGLGDATARAFRAAGHLTVATARNTGGLAGLTALGCETLTLDVTDEASRRAAVEEAERRFGPVGVLVNNAGYGQYGPLEEIPPELLRRAFETNVFGPLRMAQLVLPGMRRAGPIGVRPATGKGSRARRAKAPRVIRSNSSIGVWILEDPLQICLCAK